MNKEEAKELLNLLSDDIHESRHDAIISELEKINYFSTKGEEVKVTVLENDWEAINIENGDFNYFRKSNGAWYECNDNCLNDYEFEKYEELEKAYQRYKNPLFEIIIKESGSNLSYFEIHILDIVLFSCNFHSNDKEEKKEQLEQALNSLIEGGE